MTKSDFIELTAQQYCYLDGATGSNLVQAGMPSGVCPEKWILEHPEVLVELQKDYVRAGTDILYAPTFTSNRIKLAEYHLEEQLQEINHQLVALTRKAITDAGDGRKVWIAGDLTMTGRQLAPMGDLDLEELIAVYQEQIRSLVDAGVDLLVVETMMSLAECRAAVIAAKEVCDLPVMVSMTFEENGRTLYGTDPATAAIVLESLGVCAVGVNCSAGPDKLPCIVAQIAAVTRVPIIAKPNAGLPHLDPAGVTRYDMEPETFAVEMEKLTHAGASILGGCCGTTPEHIRCLKGLCGRERLEGVKRRPDGIRYLTSERSSLAFGLDGNLLIVGERINPTGKKLLQAQLREGCFDKVLQFAEEQEACGAAVLDVNMGMSGIDEKAMMLQAIEEVSGVTALPLSLDSSHVDVLEAALRRYPGRALINSISMEQEKLDKLLPLAVKYGAMFILLPLSDKGLPENVEEKIAIIQTISQRASKLGLGREDIVVDGLVTTVGANKKAALETLETIRYCKREGYATICGLSNISFGMPQRSYVNTAFLTLAIREGLTMAIANPSQELLMAGALAADLLLNKPDADLRYIEYTNQHEEPSPGKVPPAMESGKTSTERTNAGDSRRDRHAAEAGFLSMGQTPQERLYQAVLKGNRKGAGALTREALDKGIAPEELLNEVLLPAINQVGELFDQGKYFLPQLIASAETMKSSIELLEPLLQREAAGEALPTVIIATVEGDIHDIGKNLVALMLKNYGFRVIDLGKDVSAEEIVRVAKEQHAQIIALSALMTTTMQRMREVIARVKEEQLSSRVMIGGAVVTEEYADEIGADGYSPDAAGAVKLAKRLIAVENDG